MELAIHMKNNKTGEERIKKTNGKDASPENWSCKDFHYGSEWTWTGTEPWKNVTDTVEHIGRGYYRRKKMSKASINTDIMDYSNNGLDGIKKYVNPVPHLGGKRFNVNISFDFKDWVEIEEAKENIEEYIKRNGIPEGAISNVTPMSEYK